MRAFLILFNLLLCLLLRTGYGQTVIRVGQDDSPIKFIQSGVKLANPNGGDILSVHPGIYYEQLTISKPLTIRVDGPGIVTIGTRRIISPTQEKISVHNINLYSGPTPQDHARRLSNIADMLHNTLNLHQLSWDLVGLNECYSERVSSGLFGYYVNYQERDIPCDATSSMMLSTPCFVAHLRNSPGIIDNHFQVGEIGVLARQEKFTIQETFHAYLGNAWWTTVRRDVVGARLRMTSSGYILPFYSTHISHGGPDGTSDSNQEKQVSDLVDAVKGWWRLGDLAPVVVGDFNFYPSDSKLWNIMARDFDELGLAYGDSVIEHIWIGKQSSFQGAIGSMKAVRYEYLGEFYDEHVNLTDHPVSYAELLTPSEECVNFDPAVLSVGQFLYWWILYESNKPLPGNWLPWYFRTREDAEKALGVIRYYGMNQVCRIPGESAEFAYLLISGDPPVNGMSGEDCISFFPPSLTVLKVGNEWTLFDPLKRSYLMTFWSEGAAWRAVALINKYSFYNLCYVNRPNSPFKYFRR